MADSRYDVADYRGLDRCTETLADFHDLVATTHRLGPRLVCDLAPNHTPDQHPWLQAALAPPPGGAARSEYIFRGTAMRAPTSTAMQRRFSAVHT